VTLSQTTLYHYVERHFAECRVLFVVMLSAIMLVVIMLSVIMLIVGMKNVFMLNVVAPAQLFLLI
jgi:hypothetical protein